MITIGDRVKEAIDYMDQRKVEYALTPACIAIDMTSQKYFSKNRSAAKDYKNFLRDYLWLITYIGLPGIVSNGLKVRFSHPDVKSDSEGFCTIEEIIYHVVRCGLVHSSGVDSKIIWNTNISIGTDDAGNLHISNKLIWGLLGVVIFCEVNNDEKIDDMYWLSVADFKNFICDLWGRIDIPKKIIKMYGNISI